MQLSLETLIRTDILHFTGSQTHLARYVKYLSEMHRMSVSRLISIDNCTVLSPDGGQVELVGSVYHCTSATITSGEHCGEITLSGATQERAGVVFG